MKKILAAMIVSSLLVMTACSTNQSDNNNNSNEAVKIRIANWYGPDHPQNTALARFKEILESDSDSNINVEIFPNNQLGSEETFIDSVKQGNIEMGVPGMMMSRDVPEIAIAEMPFLFDGWEHARETLTGDIGRAITEPLIDKAGVRNLAWTVNGFRQISANKEINDYSDLSGLRIRVPNVPYYLEMAQSFGANPIAMALGELFTALESSVVDAQDNPYPTVHASSFYEVQDYMLESNHIFSPNLWIINERFFQSLTEAQREKVVSAAEQAAEYNWDISIQADQESKKFLIDNGMVINEPDEEFKNSLVESQLGVHQFFYETYSGTEDYAKQIRALVD